MTAVSRAVLMGENEEGDQDVCRAYEMAQGTGNTFNA